MPKINPHGLNLRKKSEVHAKIIVPEVGRRSRESTGDARYHLFVKKIDEWTENGEVMHQDLKDTLRKDVIKLRTGIKTLKRPADILVIGPGQGIEIIELKHLLGGTKNSIDTISIKNEVKDSTKSLVRKDHSPVKQKLLKTDLFEHFNHLKLVGKYDYIYSKYGPVFHTRYPEIVILKIASMLRPGGFARITPTVFTTRIENCLEYLKETGNSGKIELDDQGYSLVIRRLK